MNKRRLFLSAAVLLGSGALTIPLAFSQGVDATSPAATDAAVDCQGLGSATATTVVVPVAKGGPVLCISRDGMEPHVRTSLFVDGKIVSAFQSDACSWSNSSAMINAGSVPLDNGDVVIWGTLPTGSRSARLVSTSGESVEVPTYGDPASPLFATVTSGHESYRSIGAVGAETRETAPSVACSAVQK